MSVIMCRNFVLAPVCRVDHERQKWLGSESVADVLRHPQIYAEHLARAIPTDIAAADRQKLERVLTCGNRTNCFGPLGQVGVKLIF